MKEAFLICALVMPLSHFSRPEIVSWYASKGEEEKLIDWLKERGAEEVFIHPEPQEERLKEYGWERVPFRWKDNQIWIKRKPKTDQKAMEASA